MASLTADSPAVHTQQPSLKNKYVVVSGGTTGIGRATAALLAAQGANVFIFGRHAPDLRSTLEELADATGKVHGITADHSNSADVRRVFETVDREFGGLDIMINNAGISAGAITEGSDDEWRYALASDLNGYIDCSRRAVERMKARGGGHIVNIGSISAVHVNKGMSLYVTAKCAIEGFSRSLRKELGEHNIRVSLIEPGMVGTEILDGEWGDPEVQRREEERGAMLKPEDIAVAVHYCLTQPERCCISRLQIQPRRDD
jgi:NAD(P)-dependent dehydrogenase (short-subunit alcohol dehydrogenase family)